MNVGSVANASVAYNKFLDRLTKPKAADAKPSTSKSEAKPQFAFDPFDKKTWDVKTAKTSTTPASSKDSAVKAPKYAFDPFDRKTWDVKMPKGSHVDTKA